MKRGRLVIALVGVVLAVVVFRSCSSADDAPAPGTTAPAPAPEAGDAAARSADADARQRSLRDAAATVEVYLQRFVTRDIAGADALWVDGRPPAVSGEADLRLVERLRGIHITIDNVTAIDSLRVPEAVEVPVNLRAGFYEGPMRYYRGVYRLRLVAPGQWRITSAQLQATSSPD